MDTLAMSATDGRTSLRLTGPGGREETVQLAPRYVADDLLTLKYAALAGTGLCWLPVVAIQLRLKQLAEQAVADGSELPADYHRLYRTWFILGWPAFAGVLGIYWLMIAKPVF